MSPSRPRDDCVEGASAASVDATAVAVIELAETTQTPAITTALTKARHWLAGQQQTNGSWTAFGSPNANATGLAARALGASPASEKAAVWLYQHQARQGGPAPLASDIGAITVDDNAYDDAATNGLDERSTHHGVAGNGPVRLGPPLAAVPGDGEALPDRTGRLPERPPAPLCPSA